MNQNKYRKIVDGYIHPIWHLPVSLILIIVKYLCKDLAAAETQEPAFNRNHQYISDFEWVNYCIGPNKNYYPCYEYTLNIANRPRSILCQSTAPFPPPDKFKLIYKKHLRGLWIGWITSIDSLNRYKHDPDCFCPCVNQNFDKNGIRGSCVDLSFGILCCENSVHCGWRTGTKMKLDKCIDYDAMNDKYDIQIKIENTRMQFRIMGNAINLIIPRAKYRMCITKPFKCDVKLTKIVQIK